MSALSPLLGRWCGLLVGPALVACRTPPDDLAGVWVGSLECAEADLSYVTTAVLELDAPAAGRHAGGLALESRWTADDGAELRQSTGWAVTVLQAFPRGAQDVDFVRAECTEARRLSGEDPDPIAEGCGAVAGGIGTSSLGWDGADRLAWRGACSGSLDRGGAIPDDSGDPGGGAR